MPDTYGELYWTELDRMRGIAPQLLEIVSTRLTLLMRQNSIPGLTLPQTEMLRGRIQELLALQTALQDANVGSPPAKDALLQSPSGAE